MYLDRTNGILDGFLCEGKCEGRGFTLTLTLTLETPINRAFRAESEGVRAKKEKKSFFILHSSFFIFSAAASGHACKSVYNPFAPKRTKVKKIRVKDSVCICDNP